MMQPAFAKSLANCSVTSRPYAEGLREPTIATTGAPLSGNVPMKHKLFGGLAILANLWVKICSSGQILLISMTFVIKSIDMLSNACYNQERLVS